MNIILSIYIPTYNRSNLVYDQICYFDIEDAFNNNEIEIIVSNNASTDDTEFKLLEFQKTHPNLIIHTNSKNIGSDLNIHQAAYIASGKYLWIVGDDDRLYPGLIEKILGVLHSFPNLGHIFINHYIVSKMRNDSQLCYQGELDGYFSNGNELFTKIVEESGFGGLMFISANIYDRESVIKCNSIIKSSNEMSNSAIGLGYSYYSSQTSSYIFNSPMIDDNADVDWGNKSIRVWCRDIPAILFKIAKESGSEYEINDLIKNHFVTPIPEYKYILKGGRKKFGFDNFTMKWMLRYYPLLVVRDFFYIPYYSIKHILK